MRKVNAEVDKFHLTSHCGRSELLSTVKKLKGTPKVIIMHGAEENCQSLAYEIETNIGLDASAPNTGDTITI
jgi:predicted metal-dependent RNase